MTTTATTSYGALRGENDRGVVVFRGIPYARPPLGPQRFAAPRQADSWTGTRDATTFGPAAMQPVNPLYDEREVDESSEDCLFLNVWTPAADDGRRRVMVWFHGGAFTRTTSSSRWRQYL